MTEGYVTTTDGVRLYFQKAGHGPDAVVVPNAIYLYDDFRWLADNHTVIFYDLRNRGQSDTVVDTSKLARGIDHDVDDVDEIRRHFGFEKISLIGHSYLGLMVVLYAMKHPAHVNRVVQVGPAPPFFKQYPAELTWQDDIARNISSQTAALQAERASMDPVEFCRKFWALLRPLFVLDPTDAAKIEKWGYCDCPNERGFMKHLMTNIYPSMQRLSLTPEDFAKVHMPVLTIHGRKDRSAPYGGALDWVERLPNARLLTVENAAHVPWIEAPELVFGAIRDFL